MNELKRLHFNFGIATLIMIFMVCALAVFAMLSVRMASEERKLAEKTAESVSKLYEADTEAAGRLNLLRDELSSKSVGETVSFSVEIDDNSSLECEAVVVETDGRKDFRVKRWTPVTDMSGYNEDMTFWDGEELAK